MINFSFEDLSGTITPIKEINNTFLWELHWGELIGHLTGSEHDMINFSNDYHKLSRYIDELAHNN